MRVHADACMGDTKQVPGYLTNELVATTIKHFIVAIKRTET